MSHDQNWNIDKYYDETEPDEHWELRREFMETHKDKFGEDYLVALAKVFTNVEFMGCSYGQDVMRRIAELSKGVADSYREKKKNKLKRTFVQASDAAESRYSADKKPHINISTTQTVPDVDNSEGEKNSDIEHKLSILQRAQSQPGVRGQLVLIHYNTQGDFNAYSVLDCSASKAKINLSMEKTKEVENQIEKEFTLKMDDEEIGRGLAINLKEARKIVGKIALENLQQTCFMIKKKPDNLADIFRGELVNKDIKSKEKTLPKNEPQSSVSSAVPEKKSELDDSNIGTKLMKLMGWSGQGLGKEETGRTETIEVQQRVHRSGLGREVHMPMKKNLNKYIAKYAASNESQNLIFGNEYTNEDRKHIHQLARKYGLKSKSYGKEPNRQVVISRKDDSTLWDIVRELIVNGDSTEQYSLIMPTKLT